ANILLFRKILVALHKIVLTTSIILSVKSCLLHIRLIKLYGQDGWCKRVEKGSNLWKKILHRRIFLKVEASICLGINLK
ncbi:MAG: hypothetical protein ACEY3K_17530, partial [Wolbachia sp.]